jgi:LmbE family N-acetylglucosaminyl deacetylase
MRLSFTNDRALAVMAHPDDAELLCAGTLARAAADGATIAICILCSGDKGAASTIQSGGSLAQIRHDEAQKAAGLLKAELFWLGCGDGELYDTYDNRRELIETYRRFKPTLIITHDPGDYHPDHRAASALAEAASWFCASRGHVTSSAPLANPPALWFADTMNMNGAIPEFYVDVGDFLSLKQQMLQCHISQIARSGDADLAPLLELMNRQAAARGAQAGVAAAEAFRQHHAFRRQCAW